MSNMQSIIHSIDYNQAPETLKYEIATMIHRIWPDDSPMNTDRAPIIHDEEFNVHAFYSYLDGKLVSYAGVVRKTIVKDGHTFNLAGLTCVATDPDYRGQGLGFQTVAAATKWMENQPEIDFGIFTCDRSLAGFYHEAGAWTVIPDLVLIGNEDEDALSSESLEVLVLMRLFTEKSRKHEAILRHTTINLDFPEGEFL